MLFYICGLLFRPLDISVISLLAYAVLHLWDVVQATWYISYIIIDVCCFTFVGCCSGHLIYQLYHYWRMLFYICGLLFRPLDISVISLLAYAVLHLWVVVQATWYISYIIIDVCCFTFVGCCSGHLIYQLYHYWRMLFYICGLLFRPLDISVISLLTYAVLHLWVVVQATHMKMLPDPKVLNESWIICPHICGWYMLVDVLFWKCQLKFSKVILKCVSNFYQCMTCIFKNW